MLLHVHGSKHVQTLIQHIVGDFGISAESNDPSHNPHVLDAMPNSRYLVASRSAAMDA